MSRLKNSTIALAVLVLLVGALAALLPLNGRGQVPGPAQPPPSFGRPGNFYLTKTTYNGAQALTACAAGYHMASIWEIHDPSNLKYNTAYGFTQDDSGLGPPSAVGGWIRTGEASGCMSVWLPRGWLDDKFRPWVGHYSPSCNLNNVNSNNRVWCVQD